MANGAVLRIDQKGGKPDDTDCHRRRKGPFLRPAPTSITAMAHNPYSRIVLQRGMQSIKKSVVLVSSIAAILGAVGIQIVISQKAHFALIVVPILGSVALIYLLRRWADPSPPSDSTINAAVEKIRQSCISLLDFYGADRPSFRPPGVVSGPPESGLFFDIASIARSAESVDGDILIARLAESDQRLTLVLGETGSGKSALLLRIAVRLADDYLSDQSNEVPIVLGLRSWTTAYSFRHWLVDQTIATYALPRDVVTKWADRGNIIAILDGLDEVSENSRDHLMKAIHVWSHTAAGTRVVVSCRSSTPNLVHLVTCAEADQLAVVRPLSVPQVRAYARKALSELSRRSSTDPPRSALLLKKLVDEQIMKREMLRTPATMDLLASTVNSQLAYLGDDDVPGTSDDPAAEALRLGHDFLKAGDYEAAKGAYLAASSIPGSRHHALSTSLYGACLAMLGNQEEAQAAVEESVAVRLKESITPSGPDQIKSLSEDGRAVLRVMSSEVSYDLSQVSSRSGLTPSRADAALLALKGVGAIETTAEDEEGTRYQAGDAFLVEA